MTQDKIIKLAREAGFEPNSSTTVLPMKDYASHGVSYELERFAALVAAHEREACAKVVESGVLGHGECAAAIRARGEK